MSPTKGANVPGVTTTVHNPYDICRALGTKGVDTTFPYHGRRSFQLIPRPRDESPWARGQSTSSTWEELTKGREMAYVQISSMGVWIPAGLAEQARELTDTKGRKVKVTVGGVPCEGHTGSGGDTGTCGRPATATLPRSEYGAEKYDWPLCRRHYSIENGVRTRDAERREAYAERRRQDDRRGEADRAAREMLEREADLLEEAGLTGLTTDGSGHVTITAEQLVGLLMRIQ